MGTTTQTAAYLKLPTMFYLISPTQAPIHCPWLAKRSAPSQLTGA